MMIKENLINQRFFFKISGDFKPKQGKIKSC